MPWLYDCPYSVIHETVPGPAPPPTGRAAMSFARTVFGGAIGSRFVSYAEPG